MATPANEYEKTLISCGHKRGHRNKPAKNTAHCPASTNQYFHETSGIVETTAASACQAIQANETRASQVKCMGQLRKSAASTPKPVRVIKGSAGTVRFQLLPTGHSTDQGKAANKAR